MVDTVSEELGLWVPRVWRLLEEDFGWRCPPRQPRTILVSYVPLGLLCLPLVLVMGQALSGIL